MPMPVTTPHVLVTGSYRSTLLRMVPEKLPCRVCPPMAYTKPPSATAAGP